MKKSEFLTKLMHCVTRYRIVGDTRTLFLVALAEGQGILVGEFRGSRNKILDAIEQIANVGIDSGDAVLLVMAYAEEAWEYHQQELVSKEFLQENPDLPGGETYGPGAKTEDAIEP